MNGMQGVGVPGSIGCPCGPPVLPKLIKGSFKDIMSAINGFRMEKDCRMSAVPLSCSIFPIHIGIFHDAP